MKQYGEIGKERLTYCLHFIIFLLLLILEHCIAVLVLKGHLPFVRVPYIQHGRCLL